MILVRLLALAVALAQAPAGDPKFLEHMHAGLQARKEQRWDDAAREFEAAARIAPQVAEVYANLGLVRYSQSNMTEAAAAFEKALALRPGLRGVQGLLGFALLMTGRVEAAVERLEKARQEEPTNPRITSWVGMAYLEAGQYRKAVTEWEAARQVSPKDINVLLYLARAYEGVFGGLNDELYRLDAAKAREIEQVASERGASNPSRAAGARAEIEKLEAARKADPKNADTLAALARTYQVLLDQLHDEIYKLDPEKAQAALGSKVGAVGMLAPPSAPAPAATPGAAGREPLIRAACTQCHRFPPPSVLPKRAWLGKVEKMFSLANVGLLPKLNRPIGNLRVEDVAAYFETLAPAELETPPWGPAVPTSRLKLERRTLRGVPPGEGLPGTGNVMLLELFPDVPGPELVVCDMLSGWVSWTDPKNPKMGLQGIARLADPDHAEAVDLDKDGKIDLVVAELGQVMPSDKKLGGVVWLRQTSNRQFETIRVARNLGRVADAQAADFDGDGDLDIVVAEFGWITVGSIGLLENNSEKAPGQLPTFTERTLDYRVGAIHVPIADLNNDGKPDFVALISQHSETVVAFLNLGKAQFDRKEIFAAPHPHWGYSGIELVDFDKDGDLDVLATNGDTMDDMIRFKPFQGISWMENQGSYPFVHHVIARHYGVMRAEAGDLDGDGDMDVAASTWLPELDEAERKKHALPGVAWYEQTAKGKFEPHVIAEDHCDRPSLEIGDYDGDRRLEIITGVGWLGKPPTGRDPAAIEIWRQLQE